MIELMIMFLEENKIYLRVIQLIIQKLKNISRKLNNLKFIGSAKVETTTYK